MLNRRIHWTQKKGGPPACKSTGKKTITVTTNRKEVTCKGCKNMYVFRDAD